MQASAWKRWFLILILVITLLSPPSTPAYNQQQYSLSALPLAPSRDRRNGYIILVSRDLMINNIPVSEAIDIFTRRKITWDDGAKLTVISYRYESQEFRGFLTAKLGITPSQYKAKLAHSIKDGRSAPIIVNSAEEAAYVLSVTPNAIAYIPLDHTVRYDSNKVTEVRIVN